MIKETNIPVKVTQKKNHVKDALGAITRIGTFGNDRYNYQINNRAGEYLCHITTSDLKDGTATIEYL